MLLMFHLLKSALILLLNLQIYESLLYVEDNPKYVAANIFIYFYLNNTY